MVPTPDFALPALLHPPMLVVAIVLVAAAVSLVLVALRRGDVE